MHNRINEMTSEYYHFIGTTKYERKTFIGIIDINHLVHSVYWHHDFDEKIYRLYWHHKWL